MESGQGNGFVNGIFIFGWTGVELFFVLSGFLITNIVIESRRLKTGLLGFYIRRAGRIMPLYFLTFLSVALLGFFNINNKIDDITHSVLHNIWVYFTFTSNLVEFFGIDNSVASKALGPLWSVAIECHYYLIWPPILYWLGQAKSLYVALSLISLSFIGRLFFYDSLSGDIFYHSTTFHLDGLLIGAVLAICSYESNIKIRPIKALLTILLALLAAMIYAAGSVHYSSKIVQIFGFTLIPSFYALIVLSATGDTPVATFFQRKILRAFGNYSYSIYLFHWPMLLLTNQINFGSGFIAFFTHYVVFSLLCLLIAKAIWVSIEGPCNKMFRRYANRVQAG